MYIFELNYPGTWLNFHDDEMGFEIERVISSIQDTIVEAAISLSMFESCNARSVDHHSEWERDAEIRRQIDEQIRADAGDRYYQEYDKYRAISEKKVRERKAELGIVPRSYLHKIPFIHAHTFVYAVDSFGKHLDELKTYENAPKEVFQCVDEFNRLLPSVRKIRNSALHIEDRCRGYGPQWEKRKGKKMELQGFLGLSNLEGNCLSYTIDDGSYQRVEISENVLDILVRLANHLLSGFSWRGPEKIEPHY